MTPENQRGENGHSTSATGKLPVLVVDDHPVVRFGLCALIREHPHLEVVGEAGTFAEVISACGQKAPKVVLLDIRLPDGSGIEACRWIKRSHPGVQVLFLTSYADPDTLSAALEAGADGYLLKTVMGPDLADAVEKVGLGNAVIDPLLNRHILDLASGKLAGEASSGPPKLNDREKSLAELVTAGKANKEIAEILGVSEKTVRNLLSALYAKLGAKGQREALIQWSARGEK